MNTSDATQDVERLYREYKPLLTSIAYRMLGSMSEAEDAVQDVFVAVSRLNGGEEIEHPKAYLVKMTTNRALNMMKAAPRRRESYPGPWLPEPIIELDDKEQPLEQMLRHERLGYAMLVLLQTCTPPERAVFVLRESFGYDYAEIAAMLDKSEAACRKIFSRASAKIGHLQPTEHEDAPEPEMDRFVRSFEEALASGRPDAFVHLLAEDAVLLSDGGGIVRAAINPIEGPARIVAFFAGIANKGSLDGRWRRVRISGQPGLLLERDRLTPVAYTLEPDGRGGIRAIYMVSNPEKLTRISR
ncbi:RNA polymerase sigma-70 factor, ECF subfamily [Cohnella sp. OV330]|uniref:sigma-70 family RNA polymerase sigma factor n=1 Tax=Cohnella sp. OV330 TaxID=1855288 RepID=UPI0008E69B1E|nr:sigma-70 family RNA polymerase sigma factor [Cohnella sp. OV330]SFB56479.1 RNA polymerase sigma-70 factor, ECF subfamily [Cohnella sp. OV330]